MLSSVYLLKGQVLESLDNRGLACESFREALRLDVFCAEALSALTSHQMMTAAEEREMLAELPLREQCSKADPEMETLVSYLYRGTLKKYARPDDAEEAPELTVGTRALEECSDVAMRRAEVHFYNCDYEQCFKLTTRWECKENVFRL